jgi:PadR family transcriptional regulator, regulatory protein AphA
MSLKHGILGLLSYRSLAGYDLMKVFNNSLKYFWPAQSSQIYRELEGMEAEGWIRAEEQRQRGRMVKTLFAATDKGREEFDRWLGEDKVERSGTRNPFLLRLFFQSRAGADSIRRLVEERKARAEESTASLRAVTGEVIPKFRETAGDELAALCWTQAAEYGIAQFEAEIRWAEDFLAKLGALKGEDAS